MTHSFTSCHNFLFTDTDTLAVSEAVRSVWRLKPVVIHWVRHENNLLNGVVLIRDDVKQLLIAILLHLNFIDQRERRDDCRRSGEVKRCKAHS